MALNTNIVSLPKDGNDATVPLIPRKKAIATTYSSSNSTSVAVTFQTTTTMIEVTALTQGIAMRWGTSAAAVSNNNYDVIIPAGVTRQFFLPDLSTSATGLYTAANFIDQTAGSVLSVSEF